MARTSLQDVRSLPDPLFTYNWDLIIANMPGTTNSRSFTYKATSASMPGSTLEPVNVNLGPSEIKYAGRENNSHTFSVTLHETRDVGTRNMLRKWLKLARDNKANTGNYKSVYSTTLELVLYDDTAKIVKTINLVGAYIEGLDDSSLDRASAAVSTSVTFSYDDIEEDLN